MRITNTEYDVVPNPIHTPMPDLIAQGPLNENRWRRTLPGEQTVALGRAAGVWSVPWDDRVSRRHVRLRWRKERLQVERLPDARNPVFFLGQSHDRFTLKPGEHFVIGGTTFTLADERAQVSLDDKAPVTEQVFSPGYLNRLRFRDANRRIEVVSRLPEIISGAASDSEMFVRLVNVLLTGVERATAAALVSVAEDGDDRVQILHWDHRGEYGRGFSPSARLIHRAVQQGESVVHVWSAREHRETSPFTQSEDLDWAFCTPLKGDLCGGWALYVAGKLSGGETATATAPDPADLRDDVKFAELTASMFASLRKMRLLERKDASLRSFFSPVVLDALAEHDPDEILAPREVDVSVLFCDLRGFSRSSEQAAGNLLGLLNRVSQTLGVMTYHILEQGGVVGDFHGDAAMGFWGWPLEHDDAVPRACRAALGIQAEFAAAAADAAHPLADFRMGIGIASGRAVAGKIGTVDQVKVTVFGPVVNLASRLEEMTKYIHAPILLDEATAGTVRQQVPAEIARVRRVATVRPPGMATAVEISELLPPESQFPQFTDEHIAAYEAALDALSQGDWSRAFSLLHRVPAEDRVKDLLTVFIAQHNRMPPVHWDGVISLTTHVRGEPA